LYSIDRNCKSMILESYWKTKIANVHLQFSSFNNFDLRFKE